LPIWATPLANKMRFLFWADIMLARSKNERKNLVIVSLGLVIGKYNKKLK
jgi:hypothetical protein